MKEGFKFLNNSVILLSLLEEERRRFEERKQLEEAQAQTEAEAEVGIAIETIGDIPAGNPIINFPIFPYPLD